MTRTRLSYIVTNVAADGLVTQGVARVDTWNNKSRLHNGCWTNICMTGGLRYHNPPVKVIVFFSFTYYQRHYWYCSILLDSRCVRCLSHFNFKDRPARVTDFLPASVNAVRSQTMVPDGCNSSRLIVFAIMCLLCDFLNMAYKTDLSSYWLSFL